MLTQAFPQPATPKPHTRRPINPGNQTILVVDDDSYMRVFLRLALEKAGYDVLLAADADEACRESRESAKMIDLLVTDLEMGATDGRVVANALQIDTPGLRVLYLSGYPNGDSGQGPLGQDVDFVAKPFYIKELVAKVREILNRATSNPAVEATAQQST